MKYYLLSNSIVINASGHTYTISNNDYRYDKIKRYLNEGKFDLVVDAINPTKNLDKDGFTVVDGLVHYGKEPIPSVLGNQFLLFKETSWVFKSLFNFWYNLKSRVNDDAASEMIRALIDNGAYPVTEDGFYLIYSNNNADQTNSVLNKKNQSDSHIHFYNIANCPEKYFTDFSNRKNLDEVLEGIFGFSAKKLKKLALQNIFKPDNNFLDYRFFFFGETFKDVLHVDNLYEVIEKNIFHVEFGDISTYRGLNSFIKDYTREKDGSYNQKKILNFLKSSDRQATFVEIGDQYLKLKEAINLDIQQVGLVNNANEILAYMNRETMKLADPEFNLNVNENFPDYWSLNDHEVDELRLLMPNTNYDLKEWTNIMQNCIHGYANNVLKATSMIFAIMDKNTNEMIYNVEVSRKSIVQFKARGNNEPKSSDVRKITNLLKDRGLIFKE
jgi:hypothetical protein